MSPRVLLVLDVDGVLVRRKRHTVGTKPAKGWEAVADRPWQFQPRPHAAEFVAWCVSRFGVAVWSAMAEENLRPLVSQLLGDALTAQLHFVWGRERTTPTGVFIGMALQSASWIDGVVQHSLVALAAGFFLYVGLMEIVSKELVGYQTKGSGAFALLKILSLVLGFTLMAVLGIWV